MCLILTNVFELEIIETIKGKPFFNGYQFRKYRQNKNETVWVCLYEYKDMGMGRIRTKNFKIALIIYVNLM